MHKQLFQPCSHALETSSGPKWESWGPPPKPVANDTPGETLREEEPQDDAEMEPTEKGDSEFPGFEDLGEGSERKAPAGGFLPGAGPPRASRGSGAHGDRAPGETTKYFVIFEPGRYRGRLHLREMQLGKVQEGKGWGGLRLPPGRNPLHVHMRPMLPRGTVQ